jgi:hypothetical protein
MYLMSERQKRRSTIILDHLQMPKAFMYVPFFMMFTRLVMRIRGKKLDYGNLDY